MTGDTRSLMVHTNIHASNKNINTNKVEVFFEAVTEAELSTTEAYLEHMPYGVFQRLQNSRCTNRPRWNALHFSLCDRESNPSPKKNLECDNCGQKAGQV